jgi:hypothetical protein
MTDTINMFANRANLNDAELARQAELASAFVNDTIEEVGEGEWEKLDPTFAFLALFRASVHILARNGCTKAELLDYLEQHYAEETA